MWVKGIKILFSVILSNTSSSVTTQIVSPSAHTWGCPQSVCKSFQSYRPPLSQRNLLSHENVPHFKHLFSLLQHAFYHIFPLPRIPRPSPPLMGLLFIFDDFAAGSRCHLLPERFLDSLDQSILSLGSPVVSAKWPNLFTWQIHTAQFRVYILRVKASPSVPSTGASTQNVCGGCMKELQGEKEPGL